MKVYSELGHLGGVTRVSDNNNIIVVHVNITTINTRQPYICLNMYALTLDIFQHT